MFRPRLPNEEFVAGGVHVRTAPHAHTQGVYLDPFTVIFYGLEIFRCKTAQFCATRRESEMAETPGIRNGAQARENARKNSFLS